MILSGNYKAEEKTHAKKGLSRQTNLKPVTFNIVVLYPRILLVWSTGQRKSVLKMSFTALLSSHFRCLLLKWSSQPNLTSSSRNSKPTLDKNPTHYKTSKTPSIPSKDKTPSTRGSKKLPEDSSSPKKIPVGTKRSPKVISSNKERDNSLTDPAINLKKPQEGKATAVQK